MSCCRPRGSRRVERTLQSSNQQCLVVWSILQIDAHPASLFLAVFHGHMEAARVLLQHGADLSQVSTEVSILATSHPSHINTHLWSWLSPANTHNCRHVLGSMMFTEGPPKHVAPNKTSTSLHTDNNDILCADGTPIVFAVLVAPQTSTNLCNHAGTT